MHCESESACVELSRLVFSCIAHDRLLASCVFLRGNCISRAAGWSATVIQRMIFIA